MIRRSVLLGLALSIGLTAQTGAATATVTDPASQLMGDINQARATRGLVPLRVDTRLWAVAAERAGRLASSGILSHEAAGPLPVDLAARGVRWYGFGEDIGSSSGTAGIAATSIFGMWAASALHWDLLMSPQYNYLGVGLAYRARSGVTFASVVLTESPDRTGARAAAVGAIVSGNDILWSWRGWDVPLQTHSASLRDFTLQLRVDHWPWVTVARSTAATTRSTLNRAHGHWYGLRVRARDLTGNVGPWSREFRVWLP